MTDNLTLNMDAYLPLRDVVFNTLREAILKGELQPGERLMELQLASKLGVSRTPIREAIRMLEQEGLAVTMPRKGAEVARMTLKDMEDVLEVREALDELAARIACAKINDEQLENLKSIRDEFKKSLDSGDVKKIAEEDVRFHDAIYEATDNAKLIALTNNIREQMYRYRVEYLKDQNNYPILIAEHDAIVNALEQRDKEMVTAEMHTHVVNQAVAVKAVIQKQDEERNAEKNYGSVYASWSTFKKTVTIYSSHCFKQYSAAVVQCSRYINCGIFWECECACGGGNKRRDCGADRYFIFWPDDRGKYFGRKSDRTEQTG